MAIGEGRPAGKITKPYGLGGEVQLVLDPGFLEQISCGYPLFVEIDGQRVPYFITELEVTGRKQAIARLEFVESLQEARKLTGCAVFPDPRDSRPMFREKDDLGRYVGYKAYDEAAGDLGEVVDFLDQPMNPMWVIRFRGREILVPANRDFISKVDSSEKTLRLRLPDGITDL